MLSRMPSQRGDGSATVYAMPESSSAETPRFESTLRIEVPGWVLKLKTSDFHTLTRSLTPSQRPRSVGELADIACALRERVERPADSRYRLVGVGLAGFVGQDSYQAQTDLFS